MAYLDVGDTMPGGSWPLLALDVLGVFVFAVTGGLAAVRKHFDIFGVFVLAAVAGLGGGILRDLLIGSVPPVGVSDWRFVASVGAAGVITFFFHPRVSRIERSILALDGVGLGLFSVAGTLKALQYGTTPLTAVIVGVLTGIGGGAARDLLGGEVPRVLTQREYYAIPALIGATIFAAAWSLDVINPVVTWGCVALVVTIRLLALRRNWQAPTP